MIKLKSYVTPFIGGIILAVALLFVQAFCDLNLPNYMSDIVNVGIQQNGIEHAAPDAISEDGMKFITTFMTEDEKALTEENYDLVSTTDTNAGGKSYQSLYPDAAAQLYVKKTLDDDASTALDTVFGSATWTFINVLDTLSSQSGSGGVSLEMTATDDIDLETLYSMQPMLDNIPKSSIDDAHDRAITNDESMLKQSGIMLAKAFYTELGADTSAMQTAYIRKIGLLMILVALLGGVATVLVSLLSSRISSAIARNLRKDVFNKIESFSSKEFDTFSTASLITRCTNDVAQVQFLLMMGIRMIFYAPILGIGGVIMAVNKSASMSWVLVVAIVSVFGLIMVLMAVALPKFKIIQTLVDKLNLVSRENLSGLMVIRAFGTQKQEKKRFEAANDELTATNLFVNRALTVMMPLMMIIMNGITLLVIWVGAHQIANSAMQIGDMMAFMQYAMQVLMAFMMISMMFIMVPRAAVSGVRIAEVLETDLSILDPVNPKAFDPNKKGTIEFRDVDFRYHGAEEDVLSDITFKVEQGQTTAIIGSTGSGKTTLASLMLRFYDVSKGQILVDGIDVREVTQKSLRSKIGYVPQKGILLSGTIASNLKYGSKDAEDAEIEAAASIAQATEFIDERPERFDSPISQGGTNVSGGQKQRLSIARALAKKPEILLFDDSFSALDFKTDATLRRALKEHTDNVTVIVIAQRVSTIMDADQILVLDEGRIVGRGTHRELLEHCTQYFEIASTQLSKEELA